MPDRHQCTEDLRLLGTGKQRIGFALALAVLVVLPFITSPFLLDLVNQVLLASIGALALMLLTGFAGLISLGTAGLLAAGAYTVGVLVREANAPFWVTLPAAAALGALLGLIFGLPSLRLRGLYLAISTLGLHFVVVYLGGEYEAREILSTGIMIDSPSIGGWSLSSGRAWYLTLLFFAALALLISVNLQRSRTGRAWRALRERDVVASALGIDVRRFKLMAFMVSATMTAIAGALFAYFRNFVSIDAFSLYLTVQYVAMIIIGGMGSIPGALLGAGFVVLFPYAIEAIAGFLPERFSNVVFALDYAAFGVVMILFLLLEPAGLMGIWRRLRDVLAARSIHPIP
ncbi:MAG TPA: branched-chain amino acid ABC transporter permease [Xanthobacteraceae bacterium]|jgi:branched-chain amino acid transport system permease protein